MTATCRGVDVSQYQAAQNWAAHKSNGVVFATAKATEGEYTHDPAFVTHITGIRQVGLVPGGYHFAWPNEDVATQAANYAAVVKPYATGGVFTHWLDLERYSDGRNYSGRTATQIHDWATAWVAAVKKAFPGQRVGVYTSASDVAAGHLPANADAFWCPAYPGAAVDTFLEAEARPQPSVSGRSPLIWQFTSTPGGTGRLDLDLCYMSEADLRTWAAGTENTVSTTDTKVATLYDLLTKIYSLTEKDPKTGDAVAHGIGYYAGHIHFDVLQANTKLDALAKTLTDVQAQASANGASLTKALTTLAAISAAVSGEGSAESIVAAVKSALADWHPTISITG